MSHNHEICELIDTADARAGATYHYYLSLDGVEGSEKEVTKQEWVRAERRAGFHNTMEHPDEPGTGGFSAGGVSGRIVREIPADYLTEE